MKTDPEGYYHHVPTITGGITLREQFAMTILQALLANSRLNTLEDFDLHNIVLIAVKGADILIEKLNKIET